ncbi:MAG: hypothetical protein H6718_16870 [Polyangiaceae bacterium]|nr:hypothetical protein [Myxococcales bacterium]MCB9587074.1 hypothetical protein [Polyangiaceae bacterium]
MLSRTWVSWTLAALGLFAVGACGGNSSGAGGSSGGETGSAAAGKGGDDGHNWSAGGVGGTAGSSTGGGWTVAGGPGVGGNGPNCWSEPLRSASFCGDSYWDNEACTYSVTCGGESVELTYVCRGAAFELLGTPCGEPFALCPEYDLICDGVWKFAYTKECPGAFAKEGDACGAVEANGCEVGCRFRCAGVPRERRLEACN